MKQLLLIRHGKSSWNYPGMDDHDRPLNERGELDAPRIAAALVQRGVKPDAVISSTAVRAETTARLIAPLLGFAASGIETTRSLYLASPRTILSHLQQMDETVGTALVFGHNPGMHEAVLMLAGDYAVSEFPTLAVARIELDVEYWGEVDAGNGLLLELLTPRALREA